jgi:D-sedoheptulose 7-phosphate isomerase
VESYFSSLIDKMASIDFKIVHEIRDRIHSISLQNGTIFLVGNGGSAATAQHFATDLVLKPTSSSHKFRKAIALTSNGPILTAISNDFDFSEVFSRQLKVLASPGDLLFTISCSGKSKNIIESLLTAKQLGLETISLNGFSGGLIKDLNLADIQLNIDCENYGIIEDLHQAVCHSLAINLRGEDYSL